LTFGNVTRAAYRKFGGGGENSDDRRDGKAEKSEGNHGDDDG
jgi:hypothetical protein